MIDTAINFTSFIKLLLDVVPELKSVYSEHIGDYDDLLEHVFMGEVTRFAERLYINNPKSDSLARLLDFIDKSYSVLFSFKGSNHFSYYHFDNSIYFFKKWFKGCAAGQC